MKKLVMIMSIVFICSCAFAGTPPDVVKKAFAKKFPTATKVSWGVEGPKEWEAEFTLEGNKISANFSEDGTWLETEREIKAVNLPKAVLAAVKSKYSDWKIAEADKTESLKHGTIYEVDLKKGMKSKSLAFKEDGTSIKE
ncbi:PepSY-like domain-containing protein [Flavobacterium sp. 83]|jgi:hypothetical protein|uniref:PepSY-like domain-containing protein n=1 Tax=Flavobacterium sp. 83 TaxID=1131812 RepID=UPI00068F3FE6|nr:PepSY-like domain-containing protein [Flavobacterium sp. 83]